MPTSTTPELKLSEEHLAIMGPFVKEFQSGNKATRAQLLKTVWSLLRPSMEDKSEEDRMELRDVSIISVGNNG